MKQKIIEEAERLFWKYGIRSVTLDDIARRLGISKKTIYHHFTDKEDIICQVMNIHFSGTKNEAACQIIEAHNPVEEVLRMSEVIRKHSNEVNSSLLFDIQRHYPKAWAMYRQFKEEYILASVRDNLQRGLKDGLYRTDIDLEIMSRLRLECIQLGFNDEAFPPDKFKLVDVQLQLLHSFIRGILTEKGFTIYNQYNHELQQYFPSGPATGADTL